MNGQLLPKERQFLHTSVLNHKPLLVFEVGTWKGGGSTWQIVKALESNGFGKLISCESNEEFYREAFEIYKDNKFIDLYWADSFVIIDELIDSGDIPDFIFFDGPEDENTAMDDFLEMEPLLKSGCVFMMHDFDLPSIKAKKIRPFLESLETWKIQSILTHPDSVGLVKAIKL